MTKEEGVGEEKGGGCCAPPSGKGSPCCGGGSPSKSGIRYEDSFVDGEVGTPAGPVPRVHSRIGIDDVLGRWRVRWGIGRDRYRVAPGLYALGAPGADAPVLVTANYKVTFDVVRHEAAGLDAWILVLDTQGINVWCAAGEGTFGTEEVIRRVAETRLPEVVNHRRLVLPQLGAPGVAAHEVLKGCGFSVVYGPVRARDIRAFLDAGMQASPAMRRVVFPMWERLVLTPVEITGVLRPAGWAAAVLFLLAGVGPGVFSLGAAWDRGIAAVAALAAGILAGAVVTPALLPWLPGRSFSVKGGLAGGLLAACAVMWYRGTLEAPAALALLLAMTAVSSFIAMNFTGATPFTSPSGVEKEMRRALPVQAGLTVAAGLLWVGGAFLR
ncbi:MAG: hgcA [Deltaproteobacteria bacterium]|nr:hgcA [Deltaproteobacteria bacterium]